MSDHEHHEQTATASEFWETFYGESERWAPGRVNPVMAATVEPLPAGRALDLGCGEGGDAIWLAEQGWQVTAIDFSEAGLRKAAEHAAERGVADRIEFRQADLRTWTPEGEEWDLVTSCFLHLLDHGMVDATRQMAAAVAPGGTLLVAGHHPDDEHTGLRWSMPGVMFTAEELAPAVDTERFDVRAEAPTRTETRDGETHTVTDAVLVAVRS